MKAGQRGVTGRGQVRLGNHRAGPVGVNAGTFAEGVLQLFDQR